MGETWKEKSNLFLKVRESFPQKVVFQLRPEELVEFFQSKWRGWV